MKYRSIKGKALTVTEAVRHFSDYINRVAYRNESFVLHKGKKAVAELYPVPSGRRLGDLPDILSSLPRLSDKETAAFAADLDAFRETTSKDELRDPWVS